MSKIFMAGCGCEIHVIKWSSKQNMVSVKHCPLHKAAPELLNVAKRAVDYYCSEYCGGAPHTEQCKEFHGVIAKAEGRS